MKKGIGLLIIVLGLCGCVTTTYDSAPSPGQPVNNPLGTVTGDWQLWDIPDFTRSRYRSAYRDFTLSITSTAISGYAGNNYQANANWDTETVRVFGNLGTTRKLISGDRGKMSKIYLHRLSTASQWKINGEYLVLRGRHGALIFKR